jgi:hypothetical protein
MTDKIPMGEQRRRNRQATAVLQQIYLGSMVNGSQAFRTSDGSIKQVSREAPTDPNIYIACKHCGRSIAINPNAPRSRRRRFCDRDCAAKFRQRQFRQRKALT